MIANLVVKLVATSTSGMEVGFSYRSIPDFAAGDRIGRDVNASPSAPGHIQSCQLLSNNILVGVQVCTDAGYDGLAAGSGALPAVRALCLGSQDPGPGPLLHACPAPQLCACPSRSAPASALLLLTCTDLSCSFMFLPPHSCQSVAHSSEIGCILSRLSLCMCCSACLAWQCSQCNALQAPKSLKDVGCLASTSAA